MLKKLLLLVFLASVSFISSAAPFWSYSGVTGPEHWSTLSKDFSMCSSAKEQSPIDLSNAKIKMMSDLSIGFKLDDISKVVDKGYTIQVELNNAGGLTLAGDRDYSLQQFHFHTPSEHTINGKYFPMEVHFVNADIDGNIAVIGVMFKVGASNPSLQKIIDRLNSFRDQSETPLNLTDLMPKDQGHYYNYAGSLTTPPCSEGVNWFVMGPENVAVASQQQIDTFAKIMSAPNNRPLQKINDRVVYENK